MIEGSGKTSNYQTLSRVLPLIDPIITGNEVRTTVICPTVLTHDELFGYFNDNSEWRDGLIPKLMRKLHKRVTEGERKHWVVFDGPMDNSWTEKINTLLDENGTLDLANSER